MTEKFKLAAHQVYASSMMDWSDYLGIFYEAGTGKTMCALDYLYRAVQRGEVSQALVICPASMVGSWEASVDKMMLFEGYTQDGVDRLRETMTIRSFQKVYKTVRRTVRKRDGTEDVKKDIVLRDDIDHLWDCTIIDESHGLGSHSSSQTKACLTLGRLSTKRFIMSGTPVSGGGGRQDFQKLYGQLKFLDDGVFKNVTEFRKKYVTEYDRWNKPSKYRTEECEALMREYGIVARLGSCYDMPDYTETEIPCPLIEETIYTDVKKCKTRQYGFRIRNTGGQFTKLLQICSGHVTTDDGVMTLRTSKHQALRDLLEGTDDKVVIFCKYRQSIDDVAGIVGKMKLPFAVYDGRSTSETWRELQYGDAKVLICQYQAGGTGLDLYASATMILYEPPLSSLLLEQTKARIMRKGQTRSCRYIYLTTPGTFEAWRWKSDRAGVDVTMDMMLGWAKEDGMVFTYTE